MKKPNWLKSTHIKALLSHQLTYLLTRKYTVRRKSSTRNKFMVFSTDGLGDAFLKLSVIDSLAEMHGRTNLLVLTRDASAMLYESLSIPTLRYTDRHRTNPVRRLNLVKKINNLNVHTLYVMDFSLTENLVDLLHIPNKIGFTTGGQNNNHTHFTTSIAHPFYVGDALENFCKSTGLNPDLMDNTQLLAQFQNLTLQTAGRLKIAVAVGASNPLKMMRLDNLRAILTKLRAVYPDAEIVLLGSGVKEKTYASKLLSRGYDLNLKNAVSKLNLQELISRVWGCDALIGFDSALYNLSFTLGKPTVCLAWTNASVQHEKPWVKIVRGNRCEWGTADGYGCPETNSINPQQVIDALGDLMHVKKNLPKRTCEPKTAQALIAFPESPASAPGHEFIYCNNDRRISLAPVHPSLVQRRP